MRIRSKKIVPLLMVSGILVTSCAEADREVDPEASAAEFAAVIQARGESGARSGGPETLLGMLPNTQYRWPDGQVNTATDLVVVGHVTDVSPGRGYAAPPGGDEPDAFWVAFDDPRAMSRTIHAEVTVSEVIAGELTEDRILVGLGFGTKTPFEVAADGLPAMGDMVFFLLGGSPVFDYEENIWSVYEDGAMLAELESDGRLTLPAIEPERSEQLVAQTPTLQSLREAAQQPTHVEQVPEGG